jgi:YggT family protein
MLLQIAHLLIETVAGFFVYLLLARFHFQWLRVPFRNPFGEFIVAVTNWIVLPLRRIVPGLRGFDLATLAAAWLLQAVAVWVLFALRGADAAALPAAALISLVDMLRMSLHILVLALVVQALLSWFSPYHDLMPLFDLMTRAFVRPVRRVLPPIGNVDLSPLVLIILIQVLLIPLVQLRLAAAGAAL